MNIPELKNKVAHYQRNSKGRDFIVGDIHGCYEQLMVLLDCIEFDKKVDILYSVGDLVDRGKDSTACLNLIYTDWFRPVYANHEQMFVESFVGANTDGMAYSWYSNGGGWSVKEDVDYLSMVAQDVLDKLPYIIVLHGNKPEDRINIVHAEITYNAAGGVASDSDVDSFNFNAYQIDNMLWGRDISNNPKYLEAREDFPLLQKDLSITYCGHTPFVSPRQVLKTRFIDTGAVFGIEKPTPEYKLTIVDVTNNLVHMLLTYNNQYIVKTCDEVFSGE